MRARNKGEGDGEIEARKYPNDAGRRRERGRGVSQLVAESAARAAREMADSIRFWKVKSSQSAPNMMFMLI